MLMSSNVPIRYCTKCRNLITPERVARGAFYCSNDCRELDKRERRQWKADQFCRLCGKSKKGKPTPSDGASRKLV